MTRVGAAVNVVRVADLTGLAGTAGLTAPPPADADGIELWDDRRALLKLWGYVLALAVRDRAASVHYHPWRGDDALAYVVENVRYVMVPPPPELADGIVAAARSFLGRLGWARRLAAWRAGAVSGSFVLDAWGETVTWDVVCWSAGPRAGVELYRPDVPGARLPSEPGA